MTATTPDPDPSNNSSTDNTSIAVPFADLAITKTHTGDFTAGQDGTYTISVTNNGPSDAQARITMLDTLPAGETYVSATGTGWTCPTLVRRHVVHLHPGRLAGRRRHRPGHHRHGPGRLRRHRDADQPGVVLSNATLDPGPLEQHHHRPHRHRHQRRPEHRENPRPAPSPPAPTAPTPLTVANHGPSDAADVRVTDPLPAGETFVSGTGTGWTCSASGQNVTCALAGTLAASATASDITLTVAVSPSIGDATLTNTATVTAGTPDPNPSNNSSTNSSDRSTPMADLAITKTHTGDFTAGDQGTYTIGVVNNGPSDAAGPLTVVDTLPAGETFVNTTGTPASWTCADAGATLTCTQAAGLAAGGQRPGHHRHRRGRRRPARPDHPDQHGHREQPHPRPQPRQQHRRRPDRHRGQRRPVDRQDRRRRLHPGPPRHLHPDRAQLRTLRRRRPGDR